MKKDNKSESPVPLTPIDAKTAYALISDAGKQLDDKIASLTASHKLQSGARRVLACLAFGDGVSQLDLIRATHLKAPTISLIVQKMEHDGLISRRTDDLDMRLTRVYLTEKGKTVNEDIRRAVEDVENTVMTDFSDTEKQLFHSMLVRLSQNIVNLSE